ncbi:HAMP domain-containing histidine kinase, partial [Pseudomonas syringae pv. actinidiae]|nr:HAMP domain-containing histidine kinase [Pseudomonas syringae pv. actinidiae]
NIPFNLRDLLQDTLTILAPAAHAKQLELVSLVYRDTPLALSGDPLRLRQILTNLVSNAIKFTPKLGRIGVAAMSNGDEVVFTVRDSGEGIPPEQLPHIFERYWTVKEGNPTGTGLGLYISQGIIKAHGGELAAQSQVGHGSEFALRCRSHTDGFLGLEG